MPQLDLGVPVVRAPLPGELANETTFLTYLGVSVNELKKIWWFRQRMYHQFEISKGKGKHRIINAPDERLKFLQKRIASLLTNIYRVRHTVHGYAPKKSIKTNALAHLRKRFVVNIDLLDFFPSITENRIKGLLESLGIDKRVSEIIARMSCYASYLPQGAPTSPILSNMICFRLDKELQVFAKNARCIYTRYADDITFSSWQPMAALFNGTVPAAGHFPPDLLAPPLRSIFANNGFTINPDKAHYADRHSRKMVTGLKINEFINVDRRYIRNIRAAIHSVETLGPTAAQKKFEHHHAGNSCLGAHLEGKIAWLRFIRGQTDPVVRAITLRFNDRFPDRKIEVMPTQTEIRDRSVWVVEHFDGDLAQGTAFFLKEIGLVTAAHCVKGAKKIDVYHPSKLSNKFEAKVAKMDCHRDLAILQHSIPKTEFFELNRSMADVAVGDEVTALGFPAFGPGDGLNVRDGKVSSLPVKHGLKLLEVSQKFSQGMSGGPVLNLENKVIGIIHKGGPGEGRDFAIRTDVLNSWLANCLVV